MIGAHTVSAEAPPFSPGWSAVLKRTSDQVTALGHGLLAYGAARMFGGKADPGAPLSLGIACQITVARMAYILETRRER